MNKSSLVEIEERIDKVEELLCAGIGPGRVERMVAKEYAVTTRQARKYISRVYERWQTQTIADAPHRREKIIRMAERFYARALGDKQFTAAASVLALLAKMSGAFSQHGPQREQALAKLGPPPDDPTLALVWAQRCMIFGLSEVITNPSLDPERRLRWIAEIGGKIGMTHAKALVGAKLDEVAERVFGAQQPTGDELEPTSGLAWPEASRFGARDSRVVEADRPGAGSPKKKDR